MYFCNKNFVIFFCFFVATDCCSVSLCDLPRTPYKENARMIVQGLDQVLRSFDYSTLQKVIENPNGFLEQVLQTTREHAKAKRNGARIRHLLKRLIHPVRTKLLEFDLKTMDRKTILTLLAGQAIELENANKQEDDNLFWTIVYMNDSLKELEEEPTDAINFLDVFKKFKTNRAHAPETQTPSLPEQFTLVAYTATLLEQKGQFEAIRGRV